MRNTLACLLLSLLCSCAATFGTLPRSTFIDSDPRGADIVYRGKVVGITPCNITPKHNYSALTLTKDGYHSRDVELGKDSNGGWVLLGFLLWGPLELLFDAGADAFSATSDEPVTIPLATKDQKALPPWASPARSAVSPGPAKRRYDARFK